MIGLWLEPNLVWTTFQLFGVSAHKPVVSHCTSHMDPHNGHKCKSKSAPSQAEEMGKKLKRMHPFGSKDHCLKERTDK